MTTAMDLVNAIRINGSVMIIEDGEALEVDRSVRTSSGIWFEAVTRDGGTRKFDVPASMIEDDMFVTTTKAASNWPW